MGFYYILNPPCSLVLNVLCVNFPNLGIIRQLIKVTFLLFFYMYILVTSIAHLIEMLYKMLFILGFLTKKTDER